jgi:hypothetical protein
MTPEEQARIRELPDLIQNESDFEKVRALSSELLRLLDKARKEKHQPNRDGTVETFPN